METLFAALSVAFVTGLLSSFGHCLGMCGGIVALYSARQAALASAPQTVWTRVRNLLPLHLGRITTYMTLGAAVGFAGSLLNQAGGMLGWQGAFSVFVGVVMLLAALSLLGILPPVETALLSLFGGNSPMANMRGLFAKRSFFSALSLGVLWGFLPCGLVFGMLILAAGAGSLAGGALTMLAFGLGTIPTLLGFGLAANLISPKLRGGLQSVAAALLLLFAVQTVLRGLAVAGLIPSFSYGQVMLW